MIKLADSIQCTGCAACVNACENHSIIMSNDEKGFFYPSIETDTCIQCHICELVCPIGKKNAVQENYVEFYAAWNIDTKIRSESSSGGALAAVALYFIKKYNGIVFGAAYDENYLVYHTYVEESKELYRLMGAKYAQSNMGLMYKKVKEFLKEERWVLFVGTPCQVAGLYSYLGCKPSKLMLVDFVCHGVPSPLIWQKYLKYRMKMDKETKLPVKVNMRSKDTGWSRYSYSMKLEYDDNRTYLKSSGQDNYLRAFINNLSIRSSCSHCQYKSVDRISDVTLGDYWGIWNSHPELDDTKGISLIITHNKIVDEFLKNIKELCMVKTSEGEAVNENPSIIHCSLQHNLQHEFFEKVTDENFDTTVNQLLDGKQNNNKFILKRIIQFIKNISMR